jgi:hypothetical protein
VRISAEDAFPQNQWLAPDLFPAKAGGAGALPDEGPRMSKVPLTCKYPVNTGMPEALT